MPVSLIVEFLWMCKNKQTKKQQCRELERSGEWWKERKVKKWKISETISPVFKVILSNAAGNVLSLWSPVW